jgi:hypothetical protein
MNYQINLSCIPKKDLEDEYKNLAIKHVKYIYKLEKELEQYKKFHDEILNNNIINQQFIKLNEKIQELEIENQNLKNKLI